VRFHFARVPRPAQHPPRRSRRTLGTSFAWRASSWERWRSGRSMSRWLSEGPFASVLRAARREEWLDLFRTSRQAIQSPRPSRPVLRTSREWFPGRGARRARSEPRRFACPPPWRRAFISVLRAGGAAAPPVLFGSLRPLGSTGARAAVARPRAFAHRESGRKTIRRGRACAADRLRHEATLARARHPRAPLALASRRGPDPRRQPYPDRNRDTVLRLLRAHEAAHPGPRARSAGRPAAGSHRSSHAPDDGQVRLQEAAGAAHAPLKRTAADGPHR